MEANNRTYLGDGVYAYIDEINQIWLVTERYRGPPESIALEPEVFQQLLFFAERAWSLKITVTKNEEPPRRGGLSFG